MSGKKKARIITFIQKMSSDTVGGKFSKQHVMSGEGIPVPPFFCLTSAFYEALFPSIKDRVGKIVERIDFADGKSVRDSAQVIRDLFLQMKIPAGLEREILKNFDRMFGANTLVSVRSSMIGYRLEESEDSLDNPFAGISESFLYVTRGELLEKIRLCWSSGFSQEAMLYRINQGMDLFGFAVAVGIQKMIFGEKSFVLFTCNPKTASRDTVIIAGYGIGEGVVQERVPVDHYFRNFTSGEITVNLSKKTSLLTFNEANGSGLIEKKTTPKQRDSRCLSDTEIEELHELGRRIEGIFRHPQDIEGTFTADGSLHILQSRPVALDYRRQRVWTNANVTESFPGVTTALTYSFSRFFYRVIFYDGYRQMGWHRDVLHDNHERLDRMIGFLRGRVYYCLTHFYHLHSLNPLFPIFRGYWEKMMGFQSSYQTKPPGFFSRIKEKVFQAFRILRAVWIVLIYRYATHQRGMARFHLWWEGLIAPLRGKTFEQEDPIVIINEFHRVWREAGNHWGITLTNDTYLPMLYGVAEGLFKKPGLDDDPALLSDLLCGDENLLSVEIILSAVKLAELVRRDQALMKEFEKGNHRSLWEKIRTGRLNPEFCGAVKEHIHRFGDRGLQELKMEQPNIRHEPWVLVRMIGDYARSDLTVSGFREKERAVRADAEKRFRVRMKRHPLKRLFLNRLLNSNRRLIRNRENSRYCRSELFGFSKNIFIALGKHLERTGAIRSASEVWHLTMDEIFGYVDGTGVTENLQGLISIRKKEYRENLRHETPIQITTLGPVRENALDIPRAALRGGKVLKGLGSSTGKVRGTARVVLDPNEPGTITDDMILIARETDPGWLFLMLASKGIVVERGSMLSHTAITGRKFGIPTIVSLPDATRIIKNGAKIEIDGASGVVTLL